MSIPELLRLGGLVKTTQEGRSAIGHGRVSIERWTIGIPEFNLPRWVLRGVTITNGERSIRISEDGRRIVREQREASLV